MVHSFYIIIHIINYSDHSAIGLKNIFVLSKTVKQTTKLVYYTYKWIYIYNLETI